MIWESVSQHAISRPNDIALNDGTVSISYRALKDRIDEFAGWLKVNGVGVLGIALDNSADWVVADIAAMSAGIDIVPIPQYFSPQQVDHLLNAAKVDCMLTQGADQIPGLTAVSVKQLAACNTFKPMISPQGVKITFTSGSTGEPKGVVLTHEKLALVAASIVQTMEAVNVNKHLCVLPLATLLENVAGLYAPLIKGIEVNLPSMDEVGLDGSSGLDIGKFAQCINKVAPESVILVPQLLMALTTLMELDVISCSPLKMAAVGGGKVASNLLTKATAVGIPVFEGYGLSEAGSVVTLNLPAEAKPGSVGKVLPHATLRVSQSGEIEVGGTAVGGTLMEGYLGEPLDDQWFATGDLGRVDEDGFVYVTGRIKNTFITAFGRNVHPEWVEAELSQYPAIGQSLFYGEASDQNLALIWPRFDIDAKSLQQIVAEVNGGLPDYARIHVTEIVPEPLPETLITSNGRVKRAQVLERYSDVINRHLGTDTNEVSEIKEGKLSVL
jgi:long-chain acyl-CoA synthetase